MSLADTVLSVINMLMQDPALIEVVTYRKYDSQVFGAGATEETFIEVASLTALKLRHTQRSVMAATSSEIQVGDLMYVFRTEDLPVGYSLKDQIIGSDSKVKKIKALDNALGVMVAAAVEGT